MGMCLDSTPAMGEFEVEVRSESFVLHGSRGGIDVPQSIVVYPLFDNPNIGDIELNLSDIPALRAALDQIEQYLIERK